MKSPFFKIAGGVLLTLFLSVNVNAQVGQILWEDNFESLNTEIWSADLGDGCPDLCGWGNQELQFYQNENISIEEIPGEPGNFALVLEAKNESAGGKSFTSGKVTTRNNLGVKYGMIEFRIKVPDDLSTGLWPAAWMLGTNEATDGWPSCGEVDLMEMGQSTQFRNEQELGSVNENDVVGANLIFYDDAACNSQNQDCAASIAFDKFYNQPYVGSTPLTDRFLIYRMYWDEKEIRLTVEDDGLVQNFYTGPFPIGSAASEFQKPFYLIMNLAVGGNFTDAATDAQVTADLPGKMYIDYVRIRQWNGRGEVFTPEKVMANAGADKSLSNGETLSLDAGGSYGPITAYSWKSNGVEISTNAQFDFVPDPGTYSIELTVFDSEGNSNTDEMMVLVDNDGVGSVIWEDDFSTFDTDLWNKDIGDGCDEGICGWGNAELQSYQEDNVYIEEIAEEPGNFALVLEARNETAGSSQFTSGKVTTENKVAIKYGVVEVRMKVPDLEDGLWPAAWLLGVNHRTLGWPRTGEIDMMEMGHARSVREEEGFFGSPNNFVGGNLIWYADQACDPDNLSCAASIAFDKFYSTPYTTSNAMNDRFMTYRIYWDESQIRLTAVDNGTEFDLYTNPFPISSNEDAFRKPFYFILNLAVGGNFTGLLQPGDITAPLPAKMYIDYVRVREWNGKGEVTFPSNGVLANAGGDIVTEDLDKDGLETVTLDGSNSYGNVVSYEWSENGVVLSQDAVAELTLNAGIHNVKLTVTDAEGNQSSDYTKVDIRELLWEENFNSFDSETWTAEVGDGCPELCGWGNQELQYYQEENISIEEITSEPGNNALVIEAREQTVDGYSFTSARVKTEGKVSVKYGLVETRLKVPDDLSTGLWPAAWLLGSNLSEVGWPRAGEIDMMEMGHRNQFRVEEGFPGTTENDLVGGNIIFYSDDACSGSPDCAASIAFDKFYSKPYVGNTALTDRFLTYRMYWDPNQIRLTAVDNGVEFDLYTAPFPLGIDADEFHKPFFFLLNLAVGGNFTDAANDAQVTADLPGKMLIDYIRAFRWNGFGEVAVGNGIIANAGADIIALDEDGDGAESIVLDGSSSSHHSGEINSYTWSNGGNVVANGAIASLELSRGVYEVTLTVTDGDGNEATDVVLVTVSNGRLAPVADAGPDQVIEDDNGDDLAMVRLDGTASEESNSPITTYRWVEGAVVLGSGAVLDVELSTGIHVITLEVTDEDMLTGTDEVIITVVDPDNNPPVANSGGDRMLNDDNGDDLVNVSLDASASSDSDGTIVDYEWTLNGAVIATGLNASVELSTGVYEITLTVTDDDGVSSSDSFMLTIVDPDNQAPLANAGMDMLLIDSELDGSENYTLDATLSSDADGVIDSYTWTENGVLIGTGVEANVSLDLGVHTIILEITDDDGVSSQDEVIITVNQLPVADAGEDILVTDSDSNGSETVTLDASGSTDPDGSIASYSWIYEAAEIGSTAILDYDFDIGTHEVGLQVTDNFGSSTSDDLIVIVSRVDNQAPVADAGPDQTQDDDDNSRDETFQLDASGSTDDGDIISYIWTLNGQEIAEGINPEVTVGVGQHVITLEITDNEGSSSTDQVTLTVTQSVCIAEWCTGNFITEVLTNDQTTSLTFVPLNPGIGESLCILYYGTGDGPYPGYGVTPNVPYVLNDVSLGQTINYYYTYSAAPEESTIGCPNSFVVGACGNLYDVQFTVTDTDQNPIDGASVSILGQSMNTNAQGVVVFEDLESMDNVDYTVSKDGYQMAEGSIDITGNVNIPVTLDILLSVGYTPDPEDQWKLYPNPSRGAITIELFDVPGRVEYEILNTSGQVVIQNTSLEKRFRIPMESIKPGVYYIRIRSGNFSSVKSLIYLR